MTAMHVEAYKAPSVSHYRAGFIPHRTHYTSAMAFVQSHGHFAAITKDGLLCMSGVVWSSDWETIDGCHCAPDDRYFEEPMLFDVDADGFVVSREVRNWLGY